MNFKRVVITGLGTINPLGHNVAEFWENLKGGVSGAGPITRFDASKFRTQFACEVKNYEPTEYFDKKEVRKMDLYSQFALICSTEAEKEAAIKKAEGEAEAILKVQQAEAEAIKMLNAAGPDAAVIAIKSLESLQKIADGKSTKIIIPSEIQGLAGLAT